MDEDLTTPAHGDPPTRDQLAGITRHPLHAGRNRTKARIDRIEWGGRSIVLKDVADRPWLVRICLGPWQLGREVRAYRMLQGIAGIPKLLGRPDRQSLALEYIPGRNLASLRPGDLDAAFFDRLETLLEKVHQRGVAHGDLHHRDVIRGPLGEPYLVDFSTSLACGADRAVGPIRGFLYRQMCRADRRAIAKLRDRLAPGSGGSVPPRPPLYRIGSGLRRVLRRMGRRRPRPERPS